MANPPLSQQVYNAAEHNQPTSITPGLNGVMSSWAGFQYWTGAGAQATYNLIQAYRQLILEAVT